MDQERIEAELEISAELERQRAERERAEKARVARKGYGAGRQCRSLDASSHRRCGAGAAREEAARKLERSQAAWRDDGARHVEAERDRGEQETAMWRQRRRRGTQGNPRRSHTG